MSGLVLNPDREWSVLLTHCELFGLITQSCFPKPTDLTVLQTSSPEHCPWTLWIDPMALSCLFLSIHDEQVDPESDCTLLVYDWESYHVELSPACTTRGIVLCCTTSCPPLQSVYNKFLCDYQYQTQSFLFLVVSMNFWHHLTGWKESKQLEISQENFIKWPHKSWLPDGRCWNNTNKSVAFVFI